MDILLLLLSFILGSLMGLIHDQIGRKRRLDQQRTIDLQYETLLWQQLDQCKTLLAHNNALLADSIALREKYQALEQTHERTLAILN